MQPSRRPSRRGAVALLALFAGVAGALGAAAPAQAQTRAMPGSFTGYAFDTCHAPSQEQMDVWLESSPYWGVGIYIAGENRACADQPNLTVEWLHRQSRNGWRILPLTVGPQAQCNSRSYDTTISQVRASDYAAARAQGRAEARSTVRAAQSLQIAERSTLWYDLEHYDVSNNDCRRSALAFLSAWTHTLHAMDYRSGVYSSASSGIAALDNADKLSPGSYEMPDQIWWADWQSADRSGIKAKWVRPSSWMPHKRVHQYLGGHHETYGGVRINVDSDFMDVGRGSVAPKEGPHCGVPIDFADYPSRKQGRAGKQVAAAQCLLKQKHLFHGKVNGRFNRATRLAVARFQRAHAQPATGAVTRRTWVSLLSDGTSPVLKYGSANEATRRTQRALDAAGEGLAINGVFEGRTRAAVKRYQRAHDLAATGVVTDEMWVLLQAGRH
jgi:hypothetical protein